MKLKLLFLFTLLYFLLMLIIYAGWANTQNEHNTAAKIFNALTTFFLYPTIVLRDSLGVKINSYILIVNQLMDAIILAVLTEKIREKYRR